MALKHRVDRLEERLNPHGEEVGRVFLYQALPDDMEWVPEAYHPAHRFFRVSRHWVVVFSGGTEEQQREALKRLRRDPKYHKDPCGERPGRAMTGDQDATGRGPVAGGGESSNPGQPAGKDA